MSGLTFLQLAAEIEKRFLNNQPHKISYGEKTSRVYLEFFEEGAISITYGLDPADWKRIKEHINYLNNKT